MQRNQPITKRIVLGIHEKLARKDSIRHNLLETEEEISTHSTSKITCGNFILFLIYLTSVIMTTDIINNTKVSFTFYTQISQVFENLYETPSGAEVVNPNKKDFKSIQTTQDIYNWVIQTLLPGLYATDRGIQNFESKPKAGQVFSTQAVTHLRFTQRRAMVEENNDTELFYKKKWVSDHAASDTQSFGNKGYVFNYSSSLEGYPYDIPIGFQTLATSKNQFIAFWKNSGYVNTRTKSINIDFGIYNKITGFMTTVNASFEISGAGAVKLGNFLQFAFPVKPYSDQFLYIFSVLFVISMIYFAFHEVAKVYILVKAGLLKAISAPPKPLRAKEGLNVGLKAVGAFREKIINVLKAFLNHVKDPWTFLNTLSICLSLYLLITWCLVISDSEFEYQIGKLGMVDGVIKNPTPEKEALVATFNEMINRRAFKIISVVQIGTVNIVLLMLKAITYLNFVVYSSARMSGIIATTLNRIIPFIVLILVILYAFSIVLTFYFGDLIPQVSSFIKTIFYFLMNLNGNYYLTESMYLYDSIFTFFFTLVFIIGITFLLGVFFLIYAVHAYEDRAKLDDNKKKQSTIDNISDIFAFEPHLLWKIKHVYLRKLKLLYYYYVNKNSFKRENEKITGENINEKRELHMYSRFNFDITLASQNEKEGKDKVFETEITRYKMNRIRKAENFKLIWSMIFSIILAIFFLAVALAHQKTTDGRKMVKSFQTIVDSKSVLYIDERGRKVVTYFPLSYNSLQDSTDITGWLKLFQAFAVKNSYTLTSGQTFDGYFFGGVNFLLTNKFRITVRNDKILPSKTGEFNAYSNYVLANAFAIDAEPNDNENTTDIKGLITNTTYKYQTTGSFMDKGGYVQLMNVTDIMKKFTLFVNDGLIGSTCNSVVIDFPIYQLTSSNCLYVVMSFLFDDSFNVIFNYHVSLIGLNYYQGTDGIFIAFLEICILIAFFIMSARQFNIMNSKVGYYNYWYSLHIAYFPRVMVKQREKKEPEIMRKWKYVTEFQEIMNLVFLIFLFISIVTWIYYLSVRTKILEDVESFIYNSPDKNFGTFMTHLNQGSSILNFSKIIESLLILSIAVKLLYSLTHFKSFRFLAECLSKSFPDIITLLIILLIYLIGFSIFLKENIGVGSSYFQDLGYVLMLILEMFSGINNKKRGLILDNDYFKPFNFLVFYVPFLITCLFVVSNLFVGIMNRNYKLFKAQKELDNQGLVSLKEFFQMTIDAIRRKKTKLFTKLEINSETISQIKNYETMAEFEELKEQRLNFKTMDSWATMIAKAIIKESNYRRAMKQIVKQISIASQREEHMRIKDNKFHDDPEKKIGQFKMRLKLWEYYWIGTREILRLSNEFSALNARFERNKLPPKAMAAKVNAEDKIHKYIYFLERNIDQNVQNIQYIEKTARSMGYDLVLL